jgi:hypothetical protein
VLSAGWLKAQLEAEVGVDHAADIKRCVPEKIAEAASVFKRKPLYKELRPKKTAASSLVVGDVVLSKADQKRIVTDPSEFPALIVNRDAANAVIADDAARILDVEKAVKEKWDAAPLSGNVGAALDTVFGLTDTVDAPPDAAAALTAFAALTTLAETCGGWVHASEYVRKIDTDVYSLLRRIMERHSACDWCRQYFRLISTGDNEYEQSRLASDELDYDSDVEAERASGAGASCSAEEKLRRSKRSVESQIVRSRRVVLTAMRSHDRYVRELVRMDSPAERVGSMAVLDYGGKRGLRTLIAGDVPGAVVIDSTAAYHLEKSSLKHPQLEKEVKAAFGRAMQRSAYTFDLPEISAPQRAGASGVTGGMGIYTLPHDEVSGVGGSQNSVGGGGSESELQSPASPQRVDRRVPRHSVGSTISSSGSGSNTPLVSPRILDVDGEDGAGAQQQQQQQQLVQTMASEGAGARGGGGRGGVGGRRSREAIVGRGFGGAATAGWQPATTGGLEPNPQGRRTQPLRARAPGGRGASSNPS